jgi:ubiquinone/menaquinone biosynthesis C-methylase UbiE
VKLIEVTYEGLSFGTKGRIWNQGLERQNRVASSIQDQWAQDQWAQWLLHRRHGGDVQAQQAMLDTLYRIRDQVLAHAQIAAGNVVLDVGAGDGLIAFGALPLVGEYGKVIFSDISADLLEYDQTLAQQLSVQDRCEFLHSSADDLSALASASIDVVTTRSVLIYVSAKQQALREFHRVLKPGGRLSIFEPINRFTYPEPEGQFCGYDVTSVQPLAHKVRRLFERLQPPNTDPMLNFDERDMLRWVEQIRFADIHLDMHIEIAPINPVAWEVWINQAGNPKIPTQAEAMRQAFTPDEVEEFTAYLRPLVEQGKGIRRSALAYLWAGK